MKPPLLINGQATASGYPYGWWRIEGSGPFLVALVENRADAEAIVEAVNEQWRRTRRAPEGAGSSTAPQEETPVKDKNGMSLKVGDRISMTGIVTAIGPGWEIMAQPDCVECLADGRTGASQRERYVGGKTPHDAGWTGGPTTKAD